MKIALVLISCLLLLSDAQAENYAIKLDELILNLPKGWEVKIVRDYHFDPCGNKSIFSLFLTFPSVEYERKIKGGGGKTRLVHPMMSLSFYTPFTDDQFKKYERKAAEIRNSPIAVAPPYLFARLDNYWIFTSKSVKEFRHPKEKEIYQHLRNYLTCNK